MPGAADIVRHHDSDPLENPWVDGQPPSAASNGWRTTTGARSRWSAPSTRGFSRPPGWS